MLVADDSEGVVVGMDLTFSGFPIGRMRRIELGTDGNARILIDVPRQDARWLRSSSLFTLVRGLVGNIKLRAYSGVLADPPLPDNVERRVLAGDATGEIPKLMAAARDLIQNLNGLVAPGAALSGSLGHLQVATERLAGPRGALGLLLGNEADADKLLRTLDRANTLLARLESQAGHADTLAVEADAQVFGPQGLMPETRAAVLQRAPCWAMPAPR